MASHSLKVKSVIDQIEKIFGRQTHSYIMQLINDGLLDMSAKKQHYRKEEKIDLVEDQRWYELDDEVIDIVRVEIKGTDDRYVMIPKLSDSHKLLREDEY
jgi:hypothetical protein